MALRGEEGVGLGVGGLGRAFGWSVLRAFEIEGILRGRRGGGCDGKVSVWVWVSCEFAPLMTSMNNNVRITSEYLS